MKPNNIKILKRISSLNHYLSSRHSFFSTQTINKSIPNENVLNDDQKEFLTENGYLWLKNFVPHYVANNIKKRINHLLQNFDPETTKSIFKTHRNEVQHKDLYFLESGDKIRYFWEENAFDDNGNLIHDATLSINKIGHALHTLDPIIHSYVYGYLPQLTFDIGYVQPVPIQSMYICKQPGIGGEVGIHQDSTFLFTEPTKSVHGLWLCIDDTTIQNGCIWVVPKSHNTGLRNRFKRCDNDYDKTELVPLIGDGSLSKEGGIAIETKCGDLLIVHGELLHWSDANNSNQSRHALMIHCIDGQYEWPKNNWLQYEKGNQAFPQFTIDDVKQQINIREQVICGNV